MQTITPYSLKRAAQPEQRRLMVGTDIMPMTQSRITAPKKPISLAVQDKGTISADAMARYTAAKTNPRGAGEYTTAKGVLVSIAEDASGRVATLYKDGKQLASFKLDADTRVSWDEHGAPVVTQDGGAVSNGVLRGTGDGDILLRVSGADVLAGGDNSTIINLSQSKGTFTGGSGSTKFMGIYQDSSVVGGSGSSIFAGVFTNSDVTGNAGADKFSGIFAGSTLKGGEGNDEFSGLFLMQSTAMGEAGDDAFNGQFLDSRINGGDGNDSFGSDIVADSKHSIRADFVNVLLDMGDGKNTMKGTALNSTLTGGKDDDAFNGIFIDSTVSAGEGNNSISAALAVGSLFRSEGGDDAISLYTATGNTVDMGDGKNNVRIGQDTASGTWMARVLDTANTPDALEAVDLVNDQTSFDVLGREGTTALKARTANGNVVRGQDDDAMLFESGPADGKTLKSGTSAATRAFAGYAKQAERNNGFVLPR